MELLGPHPPFADVNPTESTGSILPTAILYVPHSLATALDSAMLQGGSTMSIFPARTASVCDREPRSISLVVRPVGVQPTPKQSTFVRTVVCGCCVVLEGIACRMALVTSGVCMVLARDTAAHAMLISL